MEMKSVWILEKITIIMRIMKLNHTQKVNTNTTIKELFARRRGSCALSGIHSGIMSWIC